MRASQVISNLWQDTLYAIRTMSRVPAFTVTAVFILALGTGANTAMFTVIRSVLLRPLEYSDPDNLVLVSGGATPIRFEELRSAARSFSGLSAFTNQESLTLSGRTGPAILNAVRVSGNFLKTLGLQPTIGRGFLPAEDEPGAPPVVMISAEFWQRHFSSDPQIAGKTMTLNTTPYTVIGVLPPGFRFPVSAVDVWITRPQEWMADPQSRALSPVLTIFGRIKPGITRIQAAAEVAVIHHQYLLAHPAMLDAKSKSPQELRSWKEQLVGRVRTMLWTLFGAVSFVLLIACANVASLLLSRAAARSREFAVRSALGADRGRLVGQLLAESTLLSVSGGILGMLLAVAALRIIPLLTSLNLPRSAEIHVDWIVLAFSVVLSVATGLLFGLAPALGASRPDLIRVLRAAGQDAARGSSGWRRLGLTTRGLLVIAQVGLSVVLLTGAALLIKSVSELRRVDLGFDSSQLLTVRISLPLARYDTAQKKNAFFDEVVRRVKDLPGVRSATVALFLPMAGFAGTPVQDAAKPPLKLNERQIVTILPVAPGYFQTLKIPVRSGRDFTDHDTDGAERVAIIDDATAKLLWPGARPREGFYPPGQNPIGQHLLIGGVNPKPVLIIGLVAHSRQNLEDTAWPETVYVPLAQGPQPSAMIATRTDRDPLLFSSALRDQVRAIDPDQPISEVNTMQRLAEDELGERRVMMNLLAAFAAVALVLALTGIFGVISYSVNQRMPEMGIRWALGASKAEILRLVMGQGLGLTLIGIGVGMAGAFALTRFMESLLFGVSATDPVTLAGVGLAFAVAALMAAYIPARRASRVDPMVCLRCE
jgi:putative ABC transport system permease protein